MGKHRVLAHRSLNTFSSFSNKYTLKTLLTDLTVKSVDE